MTDRIPTTEAQTERAVIELFELYHWEVRRIREDIHNRDGYGLPDLLCTSPHGLQLWVEMKRPPSVRNPRGHVRKAQRELLAAWRRRGVPCLVADCVTEELKQIAAGNDLRLGSPSGAPLAVDRCDALMHDYPWWPKEEDRLAP